MHAADLTPAEVAAPSRRLAPVRPLRVLLAGRLTCMTAPGGGETQLLATARALGELGVDARLWRPWEDKLAEADCLHLFGSAAEHLPLIEAAHNLGVPVALSTIAWFDLDSLRREPRSAPRRALACASSSPGRWRRVCLPGVESCIRPPIYCCPIRKRKPGN